MNELLLLGIVFVFSIYQAYRYARIDIELDFATWALWGITGAVYGKDFLDCKTPAVHLWYLLLSKIKQDHQVMRFIHYSFLSVLGLIYYLLSKDATGTAIFIVLVHSGFLYAFNGNVGDIPAGLILISFTITNPWIFVTLMVLIVFYEPKLVLSVLAMMLYRITDIWLPTLTWGAVLLVIAGYLWYYKHEIWQNLWYQNITIPKRMTKYRKGLYMFMPGYTSSVFLYLFPLFAIGIYYKPDILYWLPMFLYIGFIALGKVIRTQHMMPVIAWIAGAGMPVEIAIALTIIDYSAAGLYIGDIWNRFYSGMKQTIEDARKIGLALRELQGTLWVNSTNPEIYIWAKKKPPYGMLELVEINHVAIERREKMLIRLYEYPADWIVDMPGGVGIHYDFKGYRLQGSVGMFNIYQRIKK